MTWDIYCTHRRYLSNPVLLAFGIDIIDKFYDINKTGFNEKG